MKYDDVYKKMIDMLRNGLDKSLVYHSVGHTLDVLNSCKLLARQEKVGNHELTLLKTAALFHDAGFIKQYADHEDISIELARQLLPGFGYTTPDIQLIAEMVEATRMPQRPKTRLEEILADADLDYLGRDDLFMISQRLHYELCKTDKKTSLREWHEIQLAFLENHRYFTESARRLRNPGKQNNIKELKELLFPDA